MADSVAFSAQFLSATVSIPATVSPAPDFYTRGFGFFCRQELQLQKRNIPLMLRVGEPNQCHILEQKPGYRH